MFTGEKLLVLIAMTGLAACDAIVVSSGRTAADAASPAAHTAPRKTEPVYTMPVIDAPEATPSDSPTPSPSQSPSPSPSASDTVVDSIVRDVDPPRSIASLGDSITAGALANLDRRTATQATTLTYLGSQGMRRLFGKGSDNAVQDLERKELSWSTGDESHEKVWSHLHRLENLTGRHLKAGNFAVSGSEASDVVNKELPKLLEWSRKELGAGAPDYVTLLIGANDICAANAAGMTSTADYKARVQTIVTTLMTASTRTRMLVSALPDIASLKGKADSASLLPPFYNQCHNLWESMNVCPTLTRSKGSEREKVKQRVKDYNTALEQVVSAARETYGDRVRLADKVATADYNQNHISVDCFHPNPDGQQLLSDKTWSASWWAAEYDAYARYRE